MNPRRWRSLVLLTLATLTLPTRAPAAHWQFIRGGPTFFESSAVVEPLRHRLYVFGSPTEFGTPAELWSVSLDSLEEWQRVSTYGPPILGRSTSVMFADPVRDQILFYGGRHTTAGFGPFFRGDLWSLDLSGPPTFHILAGEDEGPALGSSGAAAIDTRRARLLAFGGSTTFRSSTTSDDRTWAIGSSDPATWSLLPVSPRPPVRGVAASVYDSLTDRLVISGGKDGFLPWYSDTWGLTLAGDPAWQEIPNATPTPHMVRRELSWVRPNARKLDVLDGNHSLWTLDPARSDSAVWTAAPIDPVPGLHPWELAWDEADQSAWYFDSRLGDLWRLTLDGSLEWTAALPAAGVPPPRYGGERTVFDPVLDQAHVLFGFDPRAGTLATSGRQADGASLVDWEALAVTPPPRLGASVAYDGANRRYIVFGGTANGAESADLWEYLLDMGMWAPIAASGTGPSARAWHSAVIDSVEARMIVFGGLVNTVDGPRTRGDMWSLSLTVAATWTQLTGAPVPLAYHSANWDPRAGRMLVLGGYIQTDETGNESSDLWEWRPGREPEWMLPPLNGQGPGPVRGHVAILDPRRNARLLSFGGNASPGGPLRTFQLDLSTMTWQPLVTQGAPNDDAQSISGYPDPARRRAVLFHGRTTGPGDVWTLALNDTVPAVARVLASDGSNGIAEITWRVGGDPAPLRVVCTPVGGESVVVPILPQLDNLVSFADTGVSPGDTVVYQLQATGPGGPLTISSVGVRVQGGVPPPPITFAVRPITPALSAQVDIVCSLPDAAPTRLEVYDLTGRRIHEREIGSLGPGTRTVTLDRRFKAGMYIVRVVRADRTLKARFVVVP